jgi:hypothetical protein
MLCPSTIKIARNIELLLPWRIGAKESVAVKVTTICRGSDADDHENRALLTGTRSTKRIMASGVRAAFKGWTHGRLDHRRDAAVNA